MAKGPSLFLRGSEKLKIGYFKNFGTKELKQLQLKNDELHLQAYAQDELLPALKNHEIDLAITDPRDDDYQGTHAVKLAEKSIMVILQAGNFEKNQQTIEVEDLTHIPNLIIAQPSEEATELHYHRDLLQLRSSFLAVDGFNEAALMAESGSGYFLMNELTANSIKADDLQKMFLLANGKQVKQIYAALFLKEDPQIRTICAQLKEILKQS